MKSVFEVALGLACAAGALSGACGSPSPSTSAQDSATPAPLRCAECHEPEFTTTVRPPHAGARPATCGVCHTQSSWHGTRIDHPFWVLTGAHARAAEDRQLAGDESQVKCFWCHRGDPATWVHLRTDCIACHEEDRRDVTKPDHTSFPETCESCHSTEAWKPATKKETPLAPSAAPAETAPPPTHGAQEAASARSAAAPPAHAPSPSPAPVKPPPAVAPRPDVTTKASRRR